MNMNDYQQQSAKTAIYPSVGGHRWIYPALGLVNEAGEVNGKLKKILRDHNGVIDDQKRQEIGKELGDVLWYVSQLASELKLSLDDIATNNIDKLASRQQRGTLQGDGDNR
jgi:NTP pyrophosphatase (non-canonical NTP hydrolase)